MTVLHADANAANRALDAAFAEIEQVEAVLSIYRPESDLRRLNREGRLDRPHPYLLEVLQYAAATSRCTDGAFDITVQPLWDVYARAQRRGELPPADEVDAALQRVDWRKVEVHHDRVQLAAGMQVTLNGIAQGFAADRALAALQASGVEHALIDAGEVAPLGAKAAGVPWRAGIAHPRVDDAYIALAHLDRRCLATSGDYNTKFSGDSRLHHIFDPRSGLSPTELASVSVAAPSAMAADAISTACFVLGPRRAGQVIQVLPDVDALFVLKDGRVLKTDHFPLDA